MRSSCRRIFALASLSVLELYRRRDVFVALLLAAVILVPLSTMSVFGVSGMVRYLKEVTLLLIWLFSIAIGLGVAARQFPAEFESRTIYPLLSKPVRRGEVLLGKYVGAVAATGSAVVFFYLCYVLLTGFKQGDWGSWGLLQAMVFHLEFVLVLTAMGIAGSLVLTPSANLTVCALLAVGMLLFGERLSGLVAGGDATVKVAGGLVHAFAPHLEFFDLRLRVIHGWEPVGLRVSLAVLGYALAYAATLLGLAALVLKRKRL